MPRDLICLVFYTRRSKNGLLVRAVFFVFVRIGHFGCGRRRCWPRLQQQPVPLLAGERAVRSRLTWRESARMSAAPEFGAPPAPAAIELQQRGADSGGFSIHSVARLIVAVSPAALSSALQFEPSAGFSGFDGSVDEQQFAGSGSCCLALRRRFPRQRCVFIFVSFRGAIEADGIGSSLRSGGVVLFTERDSPAR